MLRKSILWIGLLCFLLGGTTSGVFAQKPVKMPIDTDSTGGFVLNCGDFVIVEDCSIHGHFMIFTDHLTSHVSYACVAYNQSDPSKYLEQDSTAQNGRLDFSTGESTFRGLTWHITLPGQGKVFMNAGRIVFDSSFGVLFLAGPHDDIDPDIEEAFCAALR